MKIKKKNKLKTLKLFLKFAVTLLPKCHKQHVLIIVQFVKSYSN